MRGWIVAMLALAGCLGSPETPIDTAAVEPAPPPVVVEPLTIEGTVWLAPSTSQSRQEAAVEVPVEAAGSTLRAALTLGTRYGPLDTPPLLTDVVVELRDAAGEVLASGELNLGSPEATLEAEAPVEGVASLVILSYGGSDGQANGDHVDYVVEVVPPAAA